MAKPDIESLEIAAEWLERNEGGDGEAETCRAVSEWLRDEMEKQMRRNAKITQKKVLARKLGISVAQLDRYQRGIQRMPDHIRAKL